MNSETKDLISNANYYKELGIKNYRIEFLYENKLNFVSRAHQLIMKGYNWCHNKKILSIFSAPNYCYRCGNDAAIMEVEDDNRIEFITYPAAPKSMYKDSTGKESDEYIQLKYSMRYFI